MGRERLVGMVVVGIGKKDEVGGEGYWMEGDLKVGMVRDMVIENMGIS